MFKHFIQKKKGYKLAILQAEMETINHANELIEKLCMKL